MGACYEFQTTPVNCCAAAVSSSSVLVKLKELLTKPVEERIPAGGSVSDLHLLIFRKPCHTFSEIWLLADAICSEITADAMSFHDLERCSTENPSASRGFALHSAGCRGLSLVTVPRTQQTAEPPPLHAGQCFDSPLLTISADSRFGLCTIKTLNTV